MDGDAEKCPEGPENAFQNAGVPKFVRRCSLEQYKSVNTPQSGPGC